VLCLLPIRSPVANPDIFAPLNHFP
jgi:hypothetical protein